MRVPVKKDQQLTYLTCGVVKYFKYDKVFIAVTLC
jgi:hypothetical protein